MTEAENIILRFNLQPLEPEGGYFRRTWSSGDGTAIYFLLTPTTFSAFHRLEADEIWHFYAGDAVEHWELRPGAPPLRRLLGGDVLGSRAEVPQLVVPAHTWQGARLAAYPGQPQRGWALIGCTLSPGWRDQDFFELGCRTELCAAFPESFQAIIALTR